MDKDYCEFVAFLDDYRKAYEESIEYLKTTTPLPFKIYVRDLNGKLIHEEMITE